ncbi:PBP1A family penicillin-binding protein [bacterium]|nr:PBP1A family penicillin-binding protein [bacterium]
MKKPLKIFIIVSVTFFLFFTSFVIYQSQNLPSLESLENYEPSIVTVVYYRDGTVLSRHSKENRVTLPVEATPSVVKDAFVAAEDDEFFNHGGINPITILRAAIKNIQAGRKAQGGSTITQQVAKTFFLSPERSWTRKIKEVFLAFKLERTFSKDKILNLYLNQIFLGQGAYGIEAAARTYFGKSAAELSLPEAAILAGLPRAPSRDNPIASPSGAKEKQRYVLRRLLETEKITQEEHESYIEEPVKIMNRRYNVNVDAPYAAEHVRRYLIEKYGADTLYEGGLRVFTTFDHDKQIAAQDSLNKGLQNVDKRLGLRSPEESLETEELRSEYLNKQHQDLLESFYDFKLLQPDGSLSIAATDEAKTPLEPQKIYKGVLVGKNPKNSALVVQVGNTKGEISKSDYYWATVANPEEVYSKKIIRNPYSQLKVGDVIEVTPFNLKTTPAFKLEQSPLVQGSLLSYSVPKGELLAMVGGYDFYVTNSEFNRATQAIRQSGSTFKPIVYAAALASGLTPSTVIVDSPIVYGSRDEKSELEKIWKPHNYGARFYGDTRLRLALAFSRNVPTIKLTQHLGVEKVIEFARKLGLEGDLNKDLSLALGSSALSLEQLLVPWGVFANKGQHLNRHFITKIEDRNGEILEEFTPPDEVEAVLDPKLSFLITSLLKSVVDIGTGTSVQALGRPVAGKTGTTNDYKDALFLGYTPNILSGVWIGFDADRPIGQNETGGRSAAPIWLEYMKVATKDIPETDFDVPQGIIQVSIDAETGDMPNKYTKNRVMEYFLDGTAPGQQALDQDGMSTGVENKTLVITGNTLRARDGDNEDNQGTDTPIDGGSLDGDELLRDDY